MESDEKTKYENFYSNSKVEMILNEGEIDDLLEPIYTTIISKKQKSLEKGSVWIIDLVIEHNISN